MATEIVALNVAPSFTPSQCEESLKHFHSPPPGLILPVRWGRCTDDPSMIYWIQNWDSVEAHQNFVKSENFPSFFSSVQKYITGNPVIYHVLSHPFPPDKLFDFPFVQIVTAKNIDFAPTLLDTAQSIFMGTKYEELDVQVILLGWESKERAQSFTDVLTRDFPDGELSTVVIKLYAHQS